MQFVDEHDDLSCAVRHGLQYFLQTFFKLTAILGPGYQRSQVQGIQGFVLQTLRHVPRHDTAGQAFHDGGLAYTGFADEHRVVLLPAAQDLDGAADLVVTTDDRIQLALPGSCRQILTKLFQRLLAFIIGRVVEIVFVQLFNLVAVDAVLPEQRCNLAASIAGQGRCQVAYGHIALPCLAQHDAVDPGKVRAHQELPVLSFHGGNTAHQSPRLVGKCIFIYFEGLQQKLKEVIAAQCQQEMRAGHFLVVIHQSLLLRRLDDGLYFIHVVFIHSYHSRLSIMMYVELISNHINKNFRFTKMLKSYMFM